MTRDTQQSAMILKKRRGFLFIPKDREFAFARTKSHIIYLLGLESDVHVKVSAFKFQNPSRRHEISDVGMRGGENGVLGAWGLKSVHVMIGTGSHD